MREYVRVYSSLNRHANIILSVEHVCNQSINHATPPPTVVLGTVRLHSTTSLCTHPHTACRAQNIPDSSEYSMRVAQGASEHGDSRVSSIRLYTHSDLVLQRVRCVVPAELHFATAHTFNSESACTLTTSIARASAHCRVCDPLRGCKTWRTSGQMRHRRCPTESYTYSFTRRTPTR